MVELYANSIEEVPLVVAEFLAREIIEEAQQNLKKGKHFVSGELWRSSEGNIRKYPEKVSGGFDAPYADFVEYGTKPHWMPIKPLLKWAETKFGKKEGKNIAYAVQQSIAKKGTVPHPFIRNAIDTVIDRYRSD